MFEKVKTYLLFLLLFFAANLPAQEYQVQQILLNPQSKGLHVLNGIQDKNGFLWFTSEEGLFRFNGKKADLIWPEKKEKETNFRNRTFNVFQDSQGNIWFSAGNNIKWLYGNKIFSLSIGKEFPGATIKYILETGDGAIWFSDDRYLIRYKNNKLEDFSEIAGLKDKTVIRKDRERVNKLSLDNDKKLLVITTKGIKKFNGKSFDWIEKNITKFDANTCLIPGKDILMLADNSGELKIYEGNKIRSILLGRDNAIYNIYKDSYGIYWIGTKHGLNVFDGINVRQIETSKDPKASSVLHVFEDGEKNIWACTIQSVFKIQRPDFSKIAVKTISDNIHFSAIVEDSNGKLWISSHKGEIYIFDQGKLKKIFGNLNFGIKSIKDLAISRRDEIWLNTNKGLLKLKDNKITPYSEINGIRTRIISHLQYNNKGEIYFLDSAKRLRVLDGNTIRTPLHPQSTVIGTLIKNNKNEICIRSKSEIVSVDGRERIDLADLKKRLKIESTTYTNIDNDGDVWVLTLGRGIFYINKAKKTITNINYSDGLINNRTHLAFNDNEGFLWISTSSGISRFDAKTFKLTGKKYFENYLNPETESTRLVKMFFQDSKGNVWAATTHGLLKFDIKIVKKEIDYSPPKIYIAGIKLFLDKFNYSDYSDSVDNIMGIPINMRLPYNKNYLTFSFVGLNLSNPDAVEYQYKLKGFDASWSPNVKFDEITYTNLPPGKYMFEVMARNKDGQWSEKPASISFEILPPFWKTWWFYSLSFIALLSIVGAYINIKTRSLKKQKLILEKTVEERTMELQSEKMKVEAVNQDLEKSRYQLAKINELQEKWLKELSESEQELLESNESKDKLFSLISHDLRSPFRSLLVYSESMMKKLDEMTPEEIRNYLKNVHKSAENIYGLVEDLLEWSRVHTGRIECNPVLFDLSNTVKEIINVLSANAEKKKISIINNIEEDCLVSADKEMVKSVINNLISNAVKFTYTGGRIEVSAQPAEDTVEISVKDDGVGISPEDMEKLFKVGSHFHTDGTAKEKGTGLGLILCKELIEKNDGTISVVSRQGEGSMFIVTLPRK